MDTLNQWTYHNKIIYAHYVITHDDARLGNLRMRTSFRAREPMQFTIMAWQQTRKQRQEDIIILCKSMSTCDKSKIRSLGIGTRFHFRLRDGLQSVVAAALFALLVVGYI